MKFDVVYTWVDGDDPEYIQKCNRYANKKRDLNPERYRDNLHLLKYSIRSLSSFFDQYNHLYLVTTRPQKPDWINLNHPKITLVHHDEFIPEKYLPTFSSNVIESFLHLIPGLSEHFLYMNDDYLFGDDVRMETFYRNRRYRIFNTLLGENLRWRIYDGHQDIVGLGLIEHAPLLIKKEFWEAAYNLFPEESEKTRTNRFRKDTDIFPLKLYRYYMLKYQRELSDPVKLPEMLRISHFHKLMNQPEKQKRFFEKFRSKFPQFYCLNDDMGDQPHPEVVQAVRHFLEAKYPEKSEFEMG